MRIFHSMKASIGTIAKELGVSKDTLRRWEAKGKITIERTPRGHRRYDLAKILGVLPRAQSAKNTIAYARVSSHDQKDDLLRQANVLQSFCATNGWTYEIIQDLKFRSQLPKKRTAQTHTKYLLG